MFSMKTKSISKSNQFQNMWFKMLQVIPGVSYKKAVTILKMFPTFHSLLSHYHNTEVPMSEKMNLFSVFNRVIN